MTATMERAPVVMVTADGESREAEMWGQGSWTCAFCQTPVFSPEDWQQHEDDNAECYARNGEDYTPEPYSYRARYFEARECANPGCITWLNAEALARIREDQRRRQERKDRDAAEKAREQAKADAEAARKARAAELHACVRPTGEQLGFAWCCTHTEPPASYGAEPVMCEASGWDRDEFTAHVKSHGAKPLTPSVKRIKLRRKPPTVALPKLEVNPFKWARWHQEHTEPGICECGHASGGHHAWHGPGDITWACESCDCRDAAIPPATTQEADRRGQYLANGPAPHSVWVIPFEPAPWETGTAAPVLLHVGGPGRYFTDAWRARNDRR